MDKQELQFKKMTETPIPRLIIRLGIPTTISMLISGIYNMADTFFVSSYGNSASGATGVVFGLMSLIQAFGFMFGQGAGSICSRALGSKKIEKASVYASTAFFASLLAGGIVTVLGLSLIDPLMRLLGSTETILPYARDYGIYILLAAPFMCSSCVLNNVLRYEGQAAFSMIGLVSGGLLNIFFDWLLMRVFDMGIAGAGIATALSQTISFFLLLSMFLIGKTSSRLSVRYISRSPSDLGAICATGFPSLVRQGLSSVSTMLLNDCAGNYGDAAIAAMSIVNRICFFTFAVSLGIGQGFQPVCAFNYGAKKYDRVKKAFIFTVLLGEVLLGTTAVVGLNFTRELVAIFRDDAEVIAIGTLALSAQFIGQIFQPPAVCSNMLFQSAGKAGIATLLSMLRSGLFFIPVLLIMTYFMGLTGVQLAQSISDVLTTMTALPFSIIFLKKLSGKENSDAF